MRASSILTIAIALGCVLPAIAGDDKKMSNEERARAMKQVEALKQSKLEEGESGAKRANDMANRDKQALLDKKDSIEARIDQKMKEWSWVVGPDAARAGAEAKRRFFREELMAEEAKINKRAGEEATRKQAEAKRAAQGVSESVEGLKSQVSKDGKFGVIPKGSNIYVRQYGK